MRFLLLTFLVVLVSCGQGSSSSNDSGENQNQEFATVVRETDLLDVAVDVPVEITGNSIVFKQAVNKSDSGNHSTCVIAINNGDAYTYSVNGSKLSIRTSSGEKLNFIRKSGNNDSLIGSWFSESFVGDQMVHRRLTVLSESKVVMRNTCES